MTADDLIKLLAIKHGEDVFVSECKLGPSWGATSQRIDAWAMAKSWAHPHVYAYETKVARSDFLQDNKWQTYLAYCNQFYWVTAPGICTKQEIPPGCGWIEAAKSGGMLFTRIKAPWVERVIPEELYRYILMSRVQVTRERSLRENASREDVERMVEEKKVDCYWGRHMGKRIKEVIKEQILAVQKEARRMAEENEELKEIRDMVAKMGLDPKQVSSWKVRNKLEEFKQTMPPHLRYNLDSAQKDLVAAIKVIDSLTAPWEPQRSRRHE